MMAPAISVLYVEGFGVDLGLGLSPRFYFSSEEVAPYIGFKFATFLQFPDTYGAEVEVIADFLFGLTMGGEYFLNPKFSIGVEAQGNLTLSDNRSRRFGNVGRTTFNTETAIFAAVYF